jgi:hypothetical protein
MKRMVCLALGAALLLSGCATREPDALAVVRLIAADSREGDVTVTAFLAPAEEEEEAKTPSGSGQTAAEACLALTAESTNFSFLGHTEHILVGEEMAKAGLMDLLESAVLGNTLRPDSCLWVVRDETGAAWGERAGGDESVSGLDALGGKNGAPPTAIARTAAETLNDLLSYGAAVLPAVSPDGAEMEGYAVCRDGTLCGYLEGDAELGIELLMGRTCFNAWTEEGVTMWLTSVRTAVKPCFSNGAFDGVQITCRVTARRADGGQADSGQIEQARQGVEAQLHRQLNAAVEQLQKLNADAGGLKHRAMEAAPVRARQVEESWPEALEDLNVSISVQVKSDI